MSNSYFQFKQFRIEQGSAAMKVTTDACIQGAWTPVLPHVKQVLDIGTGTGLLALMLAQRGEGIMVDAIELDSSAARQAIENVATSIYCDRVVAIEGNVCNYIFTKKYDLIISNPPFFNNSLLSNKQDKNMARHTLSLSYADLLRVIDENLADGGYASVLLPVSEFVIWQQLLLNNSWMELGRLNICHTPNAPVKRIVCLFCKKSIAAIGEHTLIIKDAAGCYTKEFTQLLSPYYLDL